MGKKEKERRGSGKRGMIVGGREKREEGNNKWVKKGDE